MTRYTTYGKWVSSVNGTKSKWWYDQIPIDMCDKPIDYISLPKLNTSAQSFSDAELDSTFIAKDYFQYSGSIWIRTMSGLKSQSSPQKARDNKEYIFRLKDSFFLWFTNPTSLRIYFEADKSY